MDIERLPSTAWADDPAMVAPDRVTRPPRRRLLPACLAIPLLVPVAAALVTVAAPVGPAAAASEATVVFNGVGDHTWTVPGGVTSATFTVSGAEGGGAWQAAGGLGATVTATLSLVPGDQLDLTVAGQGQLSTPSRGGAGGFGGGGDGNAVLGAATGGSGGGGGASRVNAGEKVLLVAGGGGGAATFGYGNGGASGTAGLAYAHVLAGKGGDAGSTTKGGDGGVGGDASTWGSCWVSGLPGGAGGLGVGGNGSLGGTPGGGGGGGYYGGGGGGGGARCSDSFYYGGGGGGGSSFVDLQATSPSVSDGVRTGDGEITITYLDDAAPHSNPTTTPAPNAAGWNDTAVTVDWGWSDGGAVLDPTRCPEQSSSAGEGPVTITATCTDLAGNEATASVDVLVDLSAPTIRLVSPVDAEYERGETVFAEYTCEDLVSGVDSCVGTVASGSPLDTATVGSHSFEVTATDRAGHEQTSRVGYTITPLLATAPRELTAVIAPAPRVGSGQVKLTWTAPASSGGATITDYIIQRSTNGVTWTTVSDGVSTARSRLVSGLTNRTSYQFRVAAVNAAGQGPFSAIVRATPRWKPAAPGRVTAAVAPTPGVGSRQVRLTWNAPAATGGATITDYVIQRSTTDTTWARLRDGVSTARSTLVRRLTNGTRYRFRVAAVNAAGQGPWSATIRATPRAR
jgi:hypothetical protein